MTIGARFPRSGGRASICSGLASAPGTRTCRRIYSTSLRTPIKVRCGWGRPWDSVTWRKVTVMRAAGSPVWLPRFRDELLFRFTTQSSELNEGNTRLGADANGLFAVPLRPDRFFRDRELVASARLDEAIERPGRGAGNPVDACRHVRPADLRHDDRHNDPSRRRACLCGGPLSRRLGSP